MQHNLDIDNLSFASIAEAFPELQELQPEALGQFALFLAQHNTAEGEIDLIDSFADNEWQEHVDRVIGWARYWSDDYDTPEAFADAMIDDRLDDIRVEKLLKAIESETANEAAIQVVDYLRERNFMFHATVEPGPLTPEGRLKVIPIELVEEDGSTIFTRSNYGWVVENDKEESIDDRIKYFIEYGYGSKKTVEERQRRFAEFGTVDTERLEKLRLQYGAKAANLMLFKEFVDYVFDEHYEEDVEQGEVEIPPFTPVDGSLYSQWLDGSPQFEPLVEELRLGVISTVKDSVDFGIGSVVVIRSSAVYSEDGVDSSGAGVYESLLANPNDANAFRAAVEGVYRSANSKEAIEYRKQVGCNEDEIMGLLIQLYSENEGTTNPDKSETFFGHANSMGSNGNLIDIQSQVGTVLFDRRLVEPYLLTDVESHGGLSHALHTYHDHDERPYDAQNISGPIARASLLAEQFFGRPMQLEYVNENIVQVRPLLNIVSGEQIVFPDIEPIAKLTGTGVGDLVLPVLEYDSENFNKNGFVIMGREHAFTNHGNYRSFPGEGAILITTPSSNGHIQTYGRENGLICVYPPIGKSGTDLSWLKDFNSTSIRVVCDGYEARLYEVEEE